MLALNHLRGGGWESSLQEFLFHGHEKDIQEKKWVSASILLSPSPVTLLGEARTCSC